MVTAVVAVALAALVWPSAAARRRARRRGLAARPDRGGGAGRREPSPLVLVGGVAAAAVAVGALLSTPLVAGLAGVLAGVGAAARVRSTRRVAGERRLLALIGGVAALAAELRSGRAVAAATAAAAAACGDEATGRELARAVRAPELPAAEPGEGAADPLGRISGAVGLSARTGCSLVAVLGAIEDDLRARHRHQLELRAATAGPRAAATLLAGLPVLGLAMGSGVGADPWSVLTTTGAGQALLVAGVALELAGIAWTGRLVRRALR